MSVITVERLRSNSFLGCLINATVQPRFNLSFMGWYGDEQVLYLNDVAGTEGPVAFIQEEAIGAFLSLKCRYEWAWLLKNQEFLFRGMPADLRAAAEKLVRDCLSWPLDRGERDEGGVASAVFWSENGELTTAVPWPEFLEEGGHVLQTHFLEWEAALAEWARDYGLTPAEVGFVRRVYERKQASGSARLDLTEAESAVLREQVTSAVGWQQCLAAFAQLGIWIPDSNEPQAAEPLYGRDCQ
jgi:hypothetical protein